MSGLPRCFGKVILRFKKYSQMKLQMKREALEKLNRKANEMTGRLSQNPPADTGFGTVLAKRTGFDFWNRWRCLRIRRSQRSARSSSWIEHLPSKHSAPFQQPHHLIPAFNLFNNLGNLLFAQG